MAHRANQSCNICQRNTNRRSPASNYFQTKFPPIAFKDLEGFDRIWVIAWLHLNHNWNPTVRPPRGPNVKRNVGHPGPHRPNPIGLSAVKLVKVEGLTLHVEGIDLIDRTPVLDLKPYVRYCDAFPEAQCGYVDEQAHGGDREEDIFGESGSSWGGVDLTTPHG